jgi:uncharacterized protein (DUF2336 family)
MDGPERYRKEQDLLFQEIDERERLLRQASAEAEELRKRAKSWLHDDLMHRYRQKKFFRQMSDEDQEQFVREAIRKYRERLTAQSSGTQG